ncbi:hypothetical protein Tco_0570127 [Tanacetum coccineum]
MNMESLKVLDISMPKFTTFVKLLNSKEAVWVRKFISGLGVVTTIEKPINMYCDNTGAITIANESGITKGARHFRAKVHYRRRVIEFGDIKLEKVHTDDNLADPFTKSLAFPKNLELTRNIGMLPASSLILDLSAAYSFRLTENINGAHHLTVDSDIGLIGGIRFVVKLIGRYYNSEGNPTKYLKGVEAKAARGAQLMEKQKQEGAKVPGYNSKWSQNVGSELSQSTLISYNFI